MNNPLKEAVYRNSLPISLLFMENATTANTKPHVAITINYKQGEKIIPHDFYKHISTY